MTQKSKQFWKEKPLEALSKSEWEALCDGCAKCCLVKLIDEDSNKVYYTNVVCKYLDLMTCQCTVYERRHELVPDCVWVTLDLAKNARWIPKTCAYRKLACGEELAWWHPLISGDANSVITAGVSIKGKVVSETEVDDDDLEDMVVDWFDQE